MVSRERIKELLFYNNGKFIWRKSRGSRSAGEEAGSLTDKGYIAIKIDGVKYKAHRLAWLYVHGKWPTGEIDHIDQCKNNNSIENLRDISHKENMRNQLLRKTTSSGKTGVSYSMRDKKWRASIQVGKEYIHLYWGESFSAACIARKLAEDTYNFSNTHGRRRNERA